MFAVHIADSSSLRLSSPLMYACQLAWRLQYIVLAHMSVLITSEAIYFLSVHIAFKLEVDRIPILNSSTIYPC